MRMVVQLFTSSVMGHVPDSLNKARQVAYLSVAELGV